MIARRPGRRPGAVMTAELLLVLPILMALLAGLLGLCQLLAARQALDAAAREGARTAAVGGSADEVQLAVARTLAASGPLAQASVSVQYLEAPDQVLGAREIVVVTTSAPVALALIGSPQSSVWGLGGQTLSATAIMRVE